MRSNNAIFITFTQSSITEPFKSLYTAIALSLKGVRNSNYLLSQISFEFCLMFDAILLTLLAIIDID